MYLLEPMFSKFLKNASWFCSEFHHTNRAPIFLNALLSNFLNAPFIIMFPNTVCKPYFLCEQWKRKLPICDSAQSINAVLDNISIKSQDSASCVRADCRDHCSLRWQPSHVVVYASTYQAAVSTRLDITCRGRKAAWSKWYSLSPMRAARWLYAS
jgi:hypothetical protein